jgi:hypothetical protein
MVGDNLYIAETYFEIVHDDNFPETLISFTDGIVGVLINYAIIGPTDTYADYITVYSSGVGSTRNFLLLYPGDSLYIQDIWTLSSVTQPLGKNLSPYIFMRVPYPEIGGGAPVYITKFRLRGGLNP